MDAVTLLEEDHLHVKKLFREYDSLPDGQPERKRELAERIIRDLQVHERIEEEIFYPAFQDNTNDEGNKRIAEAKREHHVVDLLLHELHSVAIAADDFDAKFRTLRENVEHHIEAEETEMFPDARKRLKERLDALGEEMAHAKETLTRQFPSKNPVVHEKRHGRLH